MGRSHSMQGMHRRLWPLYSYGGDGNMFRSTRRAKMLSSGARVINRSKSLFSLSSTCCSLFSDMYLKKASSIFSGLILESLSERSCQSFCRVLYLHWCLNMSEMCRSGHQTVCTHMCSSAFRLSLTSSGKCSSGTFTARSPSSRSMPRARWRKYWL